MLERAPSKRVGVVVSVVFPRQRDQPERAGGKAPSRAAERGSSMTTLAAPSPRLGSAFAPPAGWHSASTRPFVYAAASTISWPSGSSTASAFSGTPSRSRGGRRSVSRRRSRRPRGTRPSRTPKIRNGFLFVARHFFLFLHIPRAPVGEPAVRVLGRLRLPAGVRAGGDHGERASPREARRDRRRRAFQRGGARAAERGGGAPKRREVFLLVGAHETGCRRRATHGCQERRAGRRVPGARLRVSVPDGFVPVLLFAVARRFFF